MLMQNQTYNQYVQKHFISGIIQIHQLKLSTVELQFKFSISRASNY